MIGFWMTSDDTGSIAPSRMMAPARDIRTAPDAGAAALAMHDEHRLAQRRGGAAEEDG